MANLDLLVGEAAEDMGAVPLVMRAEDVPYAETDGSSMFYNPSFMSDVENHAGEDGVRFILAHEMGHQVGGMDNGGHGGEFMADEYAARCLARMGASFESIANVFSMLNSPGSETHPASSARASHAERVFREERSLRESLDEDTKLDNKRPNPNVRDLTY